MRPFLIAVLACASLAYASETDTIRKSLPASTATHLKLDADFGSINAQSGASQTVSVEVFFRGDPPDRAEFNRMLHDFRLDVSQQGSEIRVNGIFVHGWEPAISFAIDNLFSSGNSMCRNWRCLTYSRWLRGIDYRISVPKQFSADLRTSGGPIAVSDLKGDVNAHTSGGGITLNGTKGRVVAHTSGGPIRMTDVGGDVDASTSGGGISIEGASGNVKAHTSGGPINAMEIGGTIDASTSGGGVTASLSGQPKGECRFSSSGGPITVKLPRDSRVNLEASTSGGSVSTDFPGQYADERHRSELHTVLNGGGPLVYVHTSGGGVRILQTGSL